MLIIRFWRLPRFLQIRSVHSKLIINPVFGENRSSLLKFIRNPTVEHNQDTKRKTEIDCGAFYPTNIYKTNLSSFSNSGRSLIKPLLFWWMGIWKHNSEIVVIYFHFISRAQRCCRGRNRGTAKFISAGTNQIGIQLGEPANHSHNAIHLLYLRKPSFSWIAMGKIARKCVPFKISSIDCSNQIRANEIDRDSFLFGTFVSKKNDFGISRKNILIRLN